MGAVIAQWLPAHTARIVVQRGCDPFYHGRYRRSPVTLAPLVDRQGSRRRYGPPPRPRFRAPVCSSPVAKGRGGLTGLAGVGGTLARCIRFSGVPSHKEGAAETSRPKR